MPCKRNACSMIIYACYLASLLKVWVVCLWCSFNILVDDCPINWAICSISPLKWSFVHRFMWILWYPACLTRVTKMCCSACVVQAESGIRYWVIPLCVVNDLFNGMLDREQNIWYQEPLYLIKTDKLISLMFTRKDKSRQSELKICYIFLPEWNSVSKYSLCFVAFSKWPPDMYSSMSYIFVSLAILQNLNSKLIKLFSHAYPTGVKFAVSWYLITLLNLFTLYSKLSFPVLFHSKVCQRVASCFIFICQTVEQIITDLVRRKVMFFTGVCPRGEGWSTLLSHPQTRNCWPIPPSRPAVVYPIFKNFIRFQKFQIQMCFRSF